MSDKYLLKAMMNRQRFLSLHKSVPRDMFSSITLRVLDSYADYYQKYPEHDEIDVEALSTLMKLKKNQSSTEAVVLNRVLEGYRKINQNVLPEAEALWLLRWEGDSAYNFLKELNLSPVNLDFLEDCYNQDWRQDEYHEPEE